MTQDYKEKLLKYLTGNLQEDQGNNVPIFNLEEEELNKNIKQTIADKLNKQLNLVYLTGKCYSELYSMFLIYGWYYDSQNVERGYIYLVDKNLDEVAFLTQFDSGTVLYNFISLQIDENNNFYGIGDNRVILLNNIFASGLKTGEYKVILRKTYFIPTIQSGSWSFCGGETKKNCIIKDKTESTYYIALENTTDVSNTYTVICRFKINVGSSNEWDNFTFPYSIDSNFSILFSKQNDNTIITYYALSKKGVNGYASYVEISIANDTVNLVKEISLNTKNLQYSTSQVAIKNVNDIYLSVILYGTEGTSEHKTTVYKLNNNSLQNLWEKDWVYYQHGALARYWDIRFQFQIVDNVAFYMIYESDGIDADYSVGIIQDTTLYTYYVNNSTNYRLWVGDEEDFYIVKQFNLVNIFIPHYTDNGNKTNELIMDYNANNYNGNNYENKNSLVPKKCRLFNALNKLIFARNLYNKVVNNNTTVSTFEIPNTLLNDETIASQNLLSETNTIMVQNEEDIEKNIYEALDINFFNTIDILNNNDTSNPIYNTLAAIRLNNSISEEIDYDDAKAIKIRINYSDDTTKIENIFWNAVNNYYRTFFAIYVDKEINSIDFISSDEDTIYCSLNKNFTVGNIYKITQDVYIDNKL